LSFKSDAKVIILFISSYYMNLQCRKRFWNNSVGSKAKNAGIAALWRVFLTKLTIELTEILAVIVRFK